MTEINQKFTAEILNTLAQKYGKPSRPATVKQDVADISDPLQAIKNRYAK